MEYNVKRAYEHRTYGEIGEVLMKAEVMKVTIDGKELPSASVEYLLNFALQSLQDAYAGAKSQDEAKGSFVKKLEALIDGKIGVRAGGGVGEETRVARTIVRGLLKKAYGADSPEWKTFTGLDDAKQNEKLDEVFGKNKDKLAPRVAERMAELKAERERKAELAKGIELSL